LVNHNRADTVQVVVSVVAHALGPRRYQPDVMELSLTDHNFFVTNATHPVWTDGQTALSHRCPTSGLRISLLSFCSRNTIAWDAYTEADIERTNIPKPTLSSTVTIHTCLSSGGSRVLTRPPFMRSAGSDWRGQRPARPTSSDDVGGHHPSSHGILPQPRGGYTLAHQSSHHGSC
jgi:hypothetical protein